jgi:hypothetical protein
VIRLSSRGCFGAFQSSQAVGRSVVIGVLAGTIPWVNAAGSEGQPLPQDENCNSEDGALLFQRLGKFVRKFRGK